MSALSLARTQAVAASVNVFHAAHYEGRNTARLQRVGEHLEEALHLLEVELAEGVRPALPPDEEGVSLCQAP
jgi:hypothetical protein